MNKLATVAVIPLFAGYLCAQQAQQADRQQADRQETTTTTTWNGTLLDAGCRTTHTEHKETKADENSTTKTETNRDTTDCPVTTSTTSYGMLTSDGHFVRFDDASNQRVVEMVKQNKNWNTYITEKKPVKVRVKGMKNGEVVVIREIQ